MSSVNDFVINNGVLIEYTGSDEKVVIPDGVKTIGEKAFWGCDSLRFVTVPEGVAEISEYAFLECANLESVSLPDSIEWIGPSAFAECKTLRSITIPKAVACISEFTFCECTSLVSVSLNNGLEEIHDSAFTGCGSLERLYIPESVSNIAPTAFDGCMTLYEISVSKDSPYFANDSEGGLVSKNSNTAYSNQKWLLWAPKNLKKVYKIDDDIEVFYTDVFRDCSELKAVVCSMESESEVARFLRNENYDLELFVSDCKGVIFSDDLSRIVKVPEDFSGVYHVPSHVEVIGAVAFNGCTKITKIYIHDYITAIRKGAFNGCSNAVLIVHKESIAEKYAKLCNLPFEYFYLYQP